MVDTKNKKDVETSLVEVGPRFCLQLIRLFNGSFGGSTLYENEQYESPNEVCVAVRSTVPRPREGPPSYIHIYEKTSIYIIDIFVGCMVNYVVYTLRVPISELCHTGY